MPSIEKTIDLSSLGLAPGSHAIAVRAVGPNRRASDLSNAVTYVVSSTPSFTIDGTTYYFDAGMYWMGWVDSAYNTDGYRGFDGHVSMFEDNVEVAAVSSDGSTYVSYYLDPIQENHSYTLIYF